MSSMILIMKIHAFRYLRMFLTKVQTKNTFHFVRLCNFSGSKEIPKNKETCSSTFVASGSEKKNSNFLNCAQASSATEEKSEQKKVIADVNADCIHRGVKTTS